MEDVPDMIEDFFLDKWGMTMDSIQTYKYRGDLYISVPANASSHNSSTTVSGGAISARPQAQAWQ